MRLGDNLHLRQKQDFLIGSAEIQCAVCRLPHNNSSKHEHSRSIFVYRRNFVSLWRIAERFGQENVLLQQGRFYLGRGVERNAKRLDSVYGVGLKTSSGGRGGTFTRYLPLPCPAMGSIISSASNFLIRDVAAVGLPPVSSITFEAQKICFF